MKVKIHKYYPHSTTVDVINGELVSYKSSTVVLSTDEICNLCLN